jgi:signal transduction histidine kinase
VETAIYFCCVQALQNAERHAPGRRVDLTLAHRPGEVSFSVRDHGSGFEVDHAEAGEGLRIMRDRMAALGGTLTIESATGAGTTVTGALPARALAVAT